MREARKPPPKSDYERQLIKVVRALSAQKKAGKGVPQLGDTSRPLSLLIVADQYDSNVGVVHVGYFKRKQKNPQAHGYRCGFHPGVFQSIDFPQGM